MVRSPFSAQLLSICFAFAFIPSLETLAQQANSGQEANAGRESGQGEAQDRLGDQQPGGNQRQAGNQRRGGEGERKIGDEKVVSGPQAGEKLGKIPVQIIPQGKPEAILKVPSEKAELREKHSEGPLLLIFMNEKSRPGFALTRLLSEYTHRIGKEKSPPTYFIMLTEDASETDKWLRTVAKHLKPSVRLAVAEGGIEGPGSLGLNRLVAMTVLVCKDSKVVDNYSLVQPSAEVDGAKLIKSIADVIGDENPPRVRQLMPRGR